MQETGKISEVKSKMRVVESGCPFLNVGDPFKLVQKSETLSRSGKSQRGGERCSNPIPSSREDKYRFTSTSNKTEHPPGGKRGRAGECMREGWVKHGGWRILVLTRQGQ